MKMDDEQLAGIAACRASKSETCRPTVPAMEAIMYDPFPVLDHGFVRVVDYMGNDATVVQAARTSYGRGTRKATEDEGLIRYLMRHRHSTPFEMAALTIHAKMPIITARQWIRHRTANVNEISGRYSILDREFYVPAAGDLAVQSTVNRQGRGEVLDAEQAQRVMELIRDDSNRAHDRYRWLLNEDDHGGVIDPDRDGLARELARIGLGLNTYTQWYWKVDCHNLMGFLALRADAHAQKEIRVYADVLVHVLSQWMPWTHAAFLEYRLGATNLSAGMMDVVRRRLAGQVVTQADTKLSKREWDEMEAALRIR